MARDARSHARSLAGIALFAAAGGAWSWFTYDPVADGARRFHVAALVFVTGVSFLSAGPLMDVRVPSRVPVAVGTLVLSLGALLPHGVRIASPMFRAGPERQERLIPSALGSWLASTVGTGEVQQSSVGLTLRAPTRGGAYVALDERDVALDLHRGTGALRRLGLAPIGRDLHETDEALRWRASYHLEAEYLTVVETNGLLVQMIRPGLLVQSRPSPQTGFADGTVIPAESSDSARVREYALLREPAGTTLSVDGVAVWRGPRRSSFGLMRIGEARPGTDHAGVVIIVDAIYERRLAADRAPAIAAWQPLRDLLSHAPSAGSTTLCLAAVIAARRRWAHLSHAPAS